ncbi:MAG: deacylase [Nitrospirae bacterium CG_4_9_14_3_um_filter_51_5]|nr:MAG: deacylase [Nitrospirae bacterium CG_4_9_14_3_um_filter_51_5]
MPILKRLQEYLGGHKITYELIRHQEAYTASEMAHTLHISGRILAKVVIVKTDERFVMAVLPSNCKVDFERLADVLGKEQVRLATEGEFKELFPDCEVGAMPPFGNLYGLEVLVDQALTEDAEIVFQAGTHLKAMKLRYQDFADLVHPMVANFHQAEGIPWK